MDFSSKLLVSCKEVPRFLTPVTNAFQKVSMTPFQVRVLDATAFVSVSAVALHALKFGATFRSASVMGVLSGGVYKLMSAKVSALTALSTIALGAGFSVPGAVLGCLAATALLARAVCNQYKHPQILAKMRTDAENLPLAKLVDLHGWKNLMEHKILSPENFLKKYQEYADTLDLQSVGRLYEEASAHSVKGFDIPRPSQWALKAIEDAMRTGRVYISGVTEMSDLGESQARFNEIYRTHADQLSFAELINLRTQMVVLCQGSGLQIPPLAEWKHKFIEETKDWTLNEICEKYYQHDLSGCMTQELFEEKFRSFAETCGFRKLCAWHSTLGLKTAAMQLGVTLPPLSEWKHKFIEEMKGKSLEQILSTYRFYDLNGCMTQEEFEKKLQAEVSSLSAGQLIAKRDSLIEQLKAMQLDLQVPPLSTWKGKVDKELKYFSLPEVLTEQVFPCMESMTQKEFEYLYRKHADTLTFSQLVSWRGDVEQFLGKQTRQYQLPSLSEYRKEFTSSTKGWSVDKILAHYDAKTIRDCLTKEQFAILEQARQQMDLRDGIVKDADQFRGIGYSFATKRDRELQVISEELSSLTQAYRKNEASWLRKLFV